MLNNIWKCNNWKPFRLSALREGEFSIYDWFSYGKVNQTYIEIVERWEVCKKMCEWVAASSTQKILSERPHKKTNKILLRDMCCWVHSTGGIRWGILHFAFLKKSVTYWNRILKTSIFSVVCSENSRLKITRKWFK